MTVTVTLRRGDWILTTQAPTHCEAESRSHHRVPRLRLHRVIAQSTTIMINYILLVSRQGACSTYLQAFRTISNQRFAGKVRLAKWFQTMPQKQKAKIVKDVTQLVLARRTRMCNFLEYKGMPAVPTVDVREVAYASFTSKIRKWCTDDTPRYSSCAGLGLATTN